MAASDEIQKLKERAREAEEKAAGATKHVKAGLEESLKTSRAKVGAEGAKLREQAKATRDKLSARTEK